MSAVKYSRLSHSSLSHVQKCFVRQLMYWYRNICTIQYWYWCQESNMSWALSVTDLLLLTMMLLIYTVWKLLKLHYISLTREFNTYIWEIIATLYIYLYIIYIMYFSTPQNPVWVVFPSVTPAWWWLMWCKHFIPASVFIQLKHWLTILHVKPIKSSVSLA